MFSRLYNRGEIRNQCSVIERGHDLCCTVWLGWRDSNPRMPGPKPGALPLGDIPTLENIIAKVFQKIKRLKK